MLKPLALFILLGGELLKLVRQGENMNIQDQTRFDRLKKTFELNFRITRLYALYLESFPEIINKEMMSALCADGEISEKDGFAAILCELFNLDMDGSADERRLIRDYINQSVRVMDARKYRNNPYYTNVRIPNVKAGNWELKTEKYPAYRGVICDDMIIFDDFREVPPLGFFTEDFEFPAVLEDGNEWMTLTPVDLDTCEDAIAAAHGRVVTFGLGLGYYAYMTARKPEVESVTVVEKSEDVIKLFETYIQPQLECADKIRIVNEDAFLYAKHTMSSEKFDYAFVDTWRDASDGAPMYERMKALEHLSPDTEFSYWIENFLISRLRAEKFSEIKKKLDKGEYAGDLKKELTSF